MRDGDEDNYENDSNGSNHGDGSRTDASVVGIIVSVDEVRSYEEDLRVAMIESNVSKLQQLLSKDLVFINHLGQVISRDDDLQAHKDQLFTIYDIVYENQQIKLLGFPPTSSTVATVTTKVTIDGSFMNGPRSKSQFRFTRVWSKSEEDGDDGNQRLQVVNGHSCLIADTGTT